MIPYGHQDIKESDIALFRAVVQSDFLTQGPVFPKFEDKVLNFFNGNYAVSVNSPISVIHIVLMALEVGPESLVWTNDRNYSLGQMLGVEKDFNLVEYGQSGA